MHEKRRKRLALPPAANQLQRAAREENSHSAVGESAGDGSGASLRDHLVRAFGPAEGERAWFQVFVRDCCCDAGGCAKTRLISASAGSGGDSRYRISAQTPRNARLGAQPRCRQSPASSAAPIRSRGLNQLKRELTLGQQGRSDRRVIVATVSRRSSGERLTAAGCRARVHEEQRSG